MKKVINEMDFLNDAFDVLQGNDEFCTQQGFIDEYLDNIVELDCDKKCIVIRDENSEYVLRLEKVWSGNAEDAEESSKTITDDFAEKLLGIAQEELKEVQQLFDGKDYDSIQDIVTENKLSYGALEPTDDYNMTDVNYKHLCVTIRNIDGKCQVCEDADIYDDNDNKIF